MYCPAVLAKSRSLPNSQLLLHEGVFHNNADEAYEEAKKTLERDGNSISEFFMEAIPVITTLEGEIDITKYQIIKNITTSVSDKKVLIPV